jgi:glucokinase
MKVAAGIDIGGTKCSVSLGFEKDGNITFIGRKSFTTNSVNSWEHALSNICDCIAQLLAENPGCQLSSAGISCGGPLDLNKGLILSPPNLPGWDNVPIVEYFQNKLGVKIFLQNDANACALAEWRYGAGKGCNNMVFLTFGTGLGAGLILDGKLYSGSSGMAGEVGHVRMEKTGPQGYGKAGSFEGFCSGGGIARLAGIMVRKKINRGESISFCGNLDEAGLLDAKIIAEAARAGDMAAKEIFETSAHYLGLGLAMLIDILNPQRIIIGSIFARCYDLLWPETYRTLKSEALSVSLDACKILPAALDEKIGDYAAISVALNCD